VKREDIADEAEEPIQPNAPLAEGAVEGNVPLRPSSSILQEEGAGEGDGLLCLPTSPGRIGRH
jgi:hypothetical protein